MHNNGGGLLSLPDEVLLKVISSDGVKVADVLNFGRTCKRINQLCHEKPAWETMLRSLDINEAPNLPPFMSADSLSSSELERLVISAVSREKIRVSKEVIQPTGMTELNVGPANVELTGTEEFLRRLDPRLLPGGKYVLAEDDGILKLWSIETQQLIWTATLERDVTCMAFDFEVVDEGNKVMVAGMFIDKERDEAYVRISAIDLSSGEEDVKVERAIPSVFIFRIMLRGDFLMVHVPHNLQVILINWKKQVSLVVDYTDSMSRRANARACVIVEEHLVVLVYVGAVTMLAIPFSAFDSRWSSSLNVDDWQTVVVNSDGSITDELGSSQEGGCSLELSPFGVEDGPWVLALHAFVPKWKGKDAPAEIHLVGYGRAFDPQWTKKLLSYRIQLTRVSADDNRQPEPAPKKSKRQLIAEKFLPEWTTSNPEPASQSHPEVVCGEWKLSVLEQSCAPASSVPWNPQCIANAGHIITPHAKVHCFKLFNNDYQPHSEVDLGVELVPGLEPTLTSVEPWSGSVVIGTPGRVRIIRFD